MLDEAQSARVAAAVTRAESSSDGEIVTIVAPASDAYHDVALHGSVLLMFLAVAAMAATPRRGVDFLIRVTGRPEWTMGELLTALMLLMALAFLLGRLVFAIAFLRRALTPHATLARRVRRRALLLFRLTVESRTRAKTGVLLYLSLAERRAEIVADAAINAKVPPETWGEAMQALLEGVRAGRPADGMVAAVERIGAVLAEHFPRSAEDTNELPDRLIQL